MKEEAIVYEFDNFDEIKEFKDVNKKNLKEYEVAVYMKEDHTKWCVELNYIG